MWYLGVRDVLTIGTIIELDLVSDFTIRMSSVIEHTFDIRLIRVVYGVGVGVMTENGFVRSLVGSAFLL